MIKKIIKIKNEIKEIIKKTLLIKISEENNTISFRENKTIEIFFTHLNNIIENNYEGEGKTSFKKFISSNLDSIKEKTLIDLNNYKITEEEVEYQINQLEVVVKNKVNNQEKEKFIEFFINRWTFSLTTHGSLEDKNKNREKLSNLVNNFLILSGGGKK